MHKHWVTGLNLITANQYTSIHSDYIPVMTHLYPFGSYLLWEDHPQSAEITAELRGNKNVGNHTAQYHHVMRFFNIRVHFTLLLKQTHREPSFHLTQHPSVFCTCSLGSCLNRSRRWSNTPIVFLCSHEIRRHPAETHHDFWELRTSAFQTHEVSSTILTAPQRSYIKS